MTAPIKNDRESGGRFVPGNPGGPGRPTGSRNKATVLLDTIADGAAAEVLQSVINAARNGDLKAAELLLSRVWPVRKGRPVRIDLPAIETIDDVLVALGKVTSAAGTGDLTPDEAAALAGVLEVKRKAIETVDLEQRLAALEAAGKERK